MPTIVLPDVDRGTIDELRKRMPDLREVEIPSIDLASLELPSFERLGRTADQRVDRLRGRSRTPSMPTWTWLAVGLGLVAVVGAIAALMTWRRSSWSPSTSDPWTEDALGSMGGSSLGSAGTGGVSVAEVMEISGTSTDPGYASGSYGSSDIGSSAATGDLAGEGSGLGLTAAEASLLSNDPSEDRSL